MLVLLLLLSLVGLLTNDFLVVELVPVCCLQVDLVTLLWLLDNIKVYLDSSALDVLAIHFGESLLGCLVGLIVDIGKALGLLGHPVVSQSNSRDGAESSEAITHIIFLEGIGEALHKDGLAISGHAFSNGL